MRTPLALAFVLVLVSLAPARPADACSCIRRGTIEADFKDTPVVLVARVVGPATDAADGSGLTYELEVEGVWKGQVKRRMLIKTRYGGGDCGRGRRLAQRWIFFARERDGVLHTSICDSSMLATKEALAGMVKKFGKPKAPGALAP